MAGTTSRRRRKARKPEKEAAPAISPTRRREILGLTLMVLGVLLTLALVTYHPSDNGLARHFSLGAALDPGNNRAENALGLVGASLAYVLMARLFGYASVLLTGLLVAWGYVIFRGRRPRALPLFSGLILLLVPLLAASFGWIGVVFEADLHAWSGDLGLGLAGWMTRVFGTVGALGLLLLGLASMTMLLVDHDLQRSLDRLEHLLAAAREGLRRRWQAWRQHQAERRRQRREARRRRREERPTPASPPPPPEPRPAPEPAIGTTEGDAIPRHELLRELAQHETPPPEPAPPEPKPAEPRQPELIVRQGVEEERADRIDRPAELPATTALPPYTPPPIDLLDAPEAHERRIDYEELEANKRILLDKLATYNIEITSINAIVGPTVTLYELTPAPGVKISKITSLEDDLAMALAAPGIRMIAPIPGKSAIGVEIPNRHRELVRIRDVIGTARFRDAQMELPIALGKTIEGEVYLQDLTRLPHLLIAGATGSGKSVGLNALITGLLYACHPANLKFVMIDPKKIELQQYAAVVDHFLAMPEGAEEPIITDFTQALSVLKSCEKEMELRYDLLSKAGVRSIKDYNRRLKEGALSPDEGHRHLPYIVVIIDELADLMMTAGKDIEGPIARLAQMARAVGIHLVLATQRPSVDVITGLIKANFPARIAYQVATKVDSRTILDQNGAEGLVGNGDLLFMMGSQLVRLQGPFVSIDEVERVTGFIAEQPGPGPYWLPSIEDEREGETTAGSSDSYDELFEEAARIIVRSQQGSVSLLQRKLSIGYTRAARIVDQLEEAGIVGPFEGSKARRVLVQSEAELDELLRSLRASS
ncbi:cell division protein FtsK/SpoIIIE [Rhodothermus marinus SG0.5JP17-172]|uniref:FtsK/SpoIIIE family DNA translocase n=1 Tax=Rhodothermus marinus TaxID=29549 RepID=UPI000223DC6A|nr:DNA translocase FtsK [Rhodothermus marinus]AEN73676.1 cell division protein FtsK/SpoIIIE [Rhodothermus marinus SG0.5JP17-172]